MSLAIYIHWPFCKAKCPYCDFNSHVANSIDEQTWHQALLSELRHMHCWMPNETVTSIFFGGGTPSLMPPAISTALIDEVAKRFTIGPNIEITLEANPTSVEASRFYAFKAAGINRVSLGIQSLRDGQLAFLGREHSATEALNAVELAAKQFDRFSFDLIYALPNQTLKAWEHELREALTFAGDHLSLYQLTIEPNTAFHHRYHAKGEFTLPEDNLAADLFLLTQDIMEEAGLPAYEISNHARPGSECRHNLSYWQGDAYLGVGPGAHGRVNIDGEWHATTTLKSPIRYLENVTQHGHAIEVYEAIDETERFEEQLMTGLRLRDGIETAQLSFILDEAKMQHYIAAGLLEQTATHLKATQHGWLLLNHLLGEILR